METTKARTRDPFLGSLHYAYRPSLQQLPLSFLFSHQQPESKRRYYCLGSRIISLQQENLFLLETLNPKSLVGFLAVPPTVRRGTDRSIAVVWHGPETPSPWGTQATQYLWA